MLFDAHNHLQDRRFHGKQDKIIGEMRESGIARCVVNGTEESDWGQVAQLARDYPDLIIPSFGLHPWKVKERSSRWREDLETRLRENPKAAVGECGLDRWISDPAFEEQLEIFREQLALGQLLDRPVTIHCLRAWGPMMDVLRSVETLPRFLMHSFNGSAEIARELVAMGGYFSFSGYFLHSRKAAQCEIFKNLPSDRILLETDAPDMNPPERFQQFPHDEINHPGNLKEIAQEFSKQTNIPLSQIWTNSQSFYQNF